VVAILRPGVQDYMSSFLNFLVVAILIFDRSLVRLVVRSWHLEFFACLFDLCSVWWCDLDILNFLLCPFIWSLFHLVVRSWHLELFARLFDLCSIWWCDLDIYLTFIPFGSAILTSWLFARLFDLGGAIFDILNFLPVYLILVVRSWHLELFARLFDLGGAILTSWTFCPFIWSLFYLMVWSYIL
jgi:hypothetical protein